MFFSDLSLISSMANAVFHLLRAILFIPDAFRQLLRSLVRNARLCPPIPAGLSADV
jgi:hypothetical protein